jgi:putative two-component system response regulator
MPGMTGFEVCRQLKSDPDTHTIPVIFVTALADEADESEGFNAGGVDYINKPISPALVRARVKTHLSLVHIDELKNTHLELIQRLGRAAEFKDNETGMHVIRMSHVSGRIALEMGLDIGFAEQLVHAAPMHDIGKIGIPDRVLLKPGRLDDEELAVMRTHPQLGAEILDKSTSSLIKLAHTVALYHHEKWDGTGYPFGLKGEEIPLEARIVAVADVFDALLSKRPYKEAWPVEKAVEEIKSQVNRHFDPQIIEAMLSCLPDLIAINAKWREE